jgi:adenosylcobinamide-GDP ribazoletransferase
MFNVCSYLNDLAASLTFYTIIPFPSKFSLDFNHVAPWAPIIGILIGSLLALLDLGLGWLEIPLTTRSAILVVFSVFLTGGLHLDGAIDAADGLAVSNPEQRLEVMKDSVVGAFGAIAAATLLLLKTVALGDIHNYRWLVLILAAGWGRWGQVMAIALYPYLRPTGKGAFHKEYFRFPQDIILGLLALLGCNGIFYWLEPERWLEMIIISCSCSAIALLTGYWFYRQLQGHTGDTYGAVVEWTEAFILCFLTRFLQ